jgi:GNAT superfamily N-acetyltransferase
MCEVFVNKRIPTAKEYLKFRKAVNWKLIDEEIAGQILEGSLFGVCIELKSEAVAMGRLVWDGGTAFYIHDIIVLPEHQKKGYGRLIMENIITYVNLNCSNGILLFVMSDKNKEGFYERFGFIRTSGDSYGTRMQLLL